MNSHRDRDAVSTAAVRGNPEGLVSEREDGAAMGNAARVHLAGTVHSDAGISIRCIDDLHLQEPGKLACIKDPDLLRDCRWIRDMRCFIGHVNRIGKIL